MVGAGAHFDGGAAGLDVFLEALLRGAEELQVLRLLLLLELTALQGVVVAARADYRLPLLLLAHVLLLVDLVLLALHLHLLLQLLVVSARHLFGALHVAAIFDTTTILLLRDGELALLIVARPWKLLLLRTSIRLVAS